MQDFTQEQKREMLVHYLWEAHQKFMADLRRVEGKCAKSGINPEEFWEAYYQHDRAEKARTVDRSSDQKG